MMKGHRYFDCLLKGDVYAQIYHLKEDIFFKKFPYFEEKYYLCKKTYANDRFATDRFHARRVGTYTS